MTEYTAGLHQLTRHTYGWLQPPGSWGFSNCGLITGGDEAVLVDTQFTLPLTRTLLAAVERAVPSTPITTVVTTHANGDHCWGNQLVDYATIVGSAATASGMGDEIRPDALVEMIAAAPPGSALGDYLRQFFGHFDFAGIHLTPPTETFIGETTVWAGHRRIDLLEVGPAHTAGDVIAYVPDQRVLYAGDILFVGDHPVMWTGPVDGWVRACERILELDPVLVVPGHGPITDQAGVLLVRDYLLRVGEHADHCYAAGTPYWEASHGLQLPDEYASWGHPERLVMTIAAIYRRLGFDGPTDLPTVLTHTAAAYRRLTIGA